MSDYQTSADIIASRVNGDFPKLALVLGSGLGSLADAIEPEVVISFGDLPGFPIPTVEGHVGNLLIGRLGGHRIACLQGRAHLYEGHPVARVVTPVRTLKLLGLEELILTNAAGSLDEAQGPGSLMLIEDHINMSGVNPLVGANDETFGVRFPDMTFAYAPALRERLATAAAKAGVTLGRGVYLMVTGPCFETPAEIHAFRTLGATAVGMSTVPECIVANHAGIKVGCISSITNYAAGMSGKALTHAETMEEGAKAAKGLVKLLTCFVQDSKA